ncbi:MAG TPA: flagellar basal body L-ring protein FlgH [Terriglobales bacterium]|nr:flagellar basal body L-ring protein FlgH [Terriglobales bacterium]
MTRRPVFVLLFLCFSIPAMAAGGGPPKARADNASLAAYLRRVRLPPPAAPPPLGSIWVDHGPLSFTGADVQALRVGDLITIHVVENTTAVGSGSVQAKRDFSAQSGLLQMFGQIGPRSGLSNLFGPSSNQALAGQAQTASSTTLSTDLTGQVVARLLNGLMVIEARRSVRMNNQQETAILRGLVRPQDVAPNNTVLSSSLGDLEVELLGKGVISDNTRPPNPITNFLLKLFGF